MRQCVNDFLCMGLAVCIKEEKEQGVVYRAAPLKPGQFSFAQVRYASVH